MWVQKNPAVVYIIEIALIQKFFGALNFEIVKQKTTIYDKQL